MLEGGVGVCEGKGVCQSQGPQGEEVAVQEEEGVIGKRQRVGGKGMVALLTGKRIDACGADGTLASWAAAEKEQVMCGTGDEIFDFPAEAIIGNGLLKTEGTDLCGLSREAGELMGLNTHQWAVDRRAWSDGHAPRCMWRCRRWSGVWCGETAKMEREDVEGV